MTSIDITHIGRRPPRGTADDAELAAIVRRITEVKGAFYDLGLLAAALGLPTVGHYSIQELVDFVWENSDQGQDIRDMIQAAVDETDRDVVLPF